MLRNGAGKRIRPARRKPRGFFIPRPDQLRPVRPVVPGDLNNCACPARQGFLRYAGRPSSKRCRILSVLLPARREGYAVGLFNTTDTDMLQAALDAAMTVIPSVFMDAWMIRLATQNATFCAAVGTPI